MEALSAERAQSEMPENYRTVAVLCDIEDLSYDEVARSVDYLLAPARSRLYRG